MKTVILAGGLGTTIDLGPAPDPWTALFGEGPGAFVVSGPQVALEALGPGLAARVIGRTGGDELSVAIAGERIVVSLDELRAAHAGLAPLFP